MSTPFTTLAKVALVGLPASSIGVITTEEQQECVDTANDLVGASLNGRYPGINQGGAGWTWDRSITYAATCIARRLMLDRRGRNPNAANADKLVDSLAEAAEKYIESVQNQSKHPYITGGEPAGGTSQGPNLISSSVDRSNSGCRGGNRGI